MSREESTLDKMRLRPRFKMYTALSPQEYSDNLREFIRDKNELTGNINRETSIISVKTERDTYWKPFLSLRSEHEDGKTAIRGVFGPSSAVWTFIMFLYFLFGILWMVFITLWFVGKQINITDYQWALPLSFIMLFLLLFTYLATIIGQRKAENEMNQLRQFAIDSTLKHEKTD